MSRGSPGEGRKKNQIEKRNGKREGDVWRSERGGIEGGGRGAQMGLLLLS